MTVRAYKKETYFSEGFARDSDTNGQTIFTFFGVTRHMSSLIDTSNFVFVLINSLLIVILKNHTDSLDTDLVSVTLSLSFELAIFLNVAVRYITEAENLMTSAQRTIEYARMDSEDDLVKPFDPDNFPQTPEITFKNTTMRYRKELEPVLKGITYTIKPGEKVGIVGR